jgi:hypothetical protein
MTILGLQRRIREVGRIRLGTSTPSGNSKRPRKLDKFRFTSPDRGVIEAVAALLGGTAQEWDNNGAVQWEVFTEANEVKILLPPNASDMSFSQFYEQWAKGFCSHRCDGERNQARDTACTCDPENRACKPTTRLSVLVPEIPGLGLWRLESHGYYAAVELAGAVELIGQMAGARSMIPARLRLERREVRRLEGTKPVVRKFAVPVIDLDVSILGVRALASHTVDELPEIEAGDGWAPVPEVEAPTVLSIESQVREHEEAKPRRTTQAPLPATGRPRRNAAEVTEQSCDICTKPYGAEPLVKNPTEGGSRFVHRSCLNTETPTDVGESPPPESVADGGDGSPSGSPEASPAEPVPAVARPSTPTAAQPQGDWPMTAGQHRKIMAMTAELFPVAPGTPGPEADGYRREVTLEICRVLGYPGLESRTDITREIAKLLLDALTKLESGEYVWDATELRLVDAATGEIVG